jgi:hypothetical protein
MHLPQLCPPSIVKTVEIEKRVYGPEFGSQVTHRVFHNLGVGPKKNFGVNVNLEIDNEKR